MEFLKYTAASAAALALDYGVYWLLAGQLGVGIGPAAALGYGAGMVLAYLLLSAGVFRGRWLAGRRGSSSSGSAVAPCWRRRTSAAARSPVSTPRPSTWARS